MAEFKRFPSTIWDVLSSAKRGEAAGLNQLVSLYKAPVVGFIQAQGQDVNDAEDLAQEVLIKICDPDFLTKYTSPDRGRFRNLLLAVTKQLIARDQTRRHAIKRGGQAKTLSLDQLKEDSKFDPERSVDPEDRTFNDLWVQHMIGQALDKLREESEIRKNQQFAALKLFMDGRKYQEIADELKTTLNDVKSLIHQARHKARRYVKEQILHYTRSQAEYGDEIEQLTPFLKSFLTEE
jgi:RNA polymerase sigma factor (sigma-70 family)